MEESSISVVFPNISVMATMANGSPLPGFCPAFMPMYNTAVYSTTEVVVVGGGGGGGDTIENKLT